MNNLQMDSKHHKGGWIANTLKEVGYEVTRQVGYSAREKSASKAKMNKIALDDIMKSAELNN